MRKKWVKRILAMAIVATMTSISCMTGMGIVNAEEAVSEVVAPTLTVTGMRPGDGQNWSDVAVGDELSLVLEVVNDTEEVVTTAGYGSVDWETDSQSDSYQEIYVQADMDEKSFQPHEAGTLEMFFQIPQYQEAGAMNLSMLSFEMENGTNEYYVLAHSEWGQSLYGTFTDTAWEHYDLAEVPYKGEVDFVITKGGKADQDVPLINGVSIITDEPGTEGTVSIQVDYTEEISGIKNMDVEFKTENEDYEYFTLYSDETTPEQYVGNVPLELSSKQHRRLGDTYYLESISVEDYAGNYQTYWRAEDGTMTSWDDETGFPAVSYSVTKEIQLKGIRVTDARIEGVDRENVAAGDSFDVVLQLKNELEKSYDIDDTYIDWYDAEGDSSRDHAKQGEKISLASGETIELRLPVTVNKFAKAEEYYCKNIGITIYDDDQYVGNTNYSLGESSYIFDGTDTAESAPLACQSNLNYIIMQSDTPDTEAPYIRELRFVTDPIRTPGNVLIELEADEGNAKLAGVELSMYRDEQSISQAQRYSFSIGQNMFYSQERQCYVLKMALGSDIVEGTYRVDMLGAWDEADQYRGYYKSSEGNIIEDDASGEWLASPTFVVAESEGKDMDFDVPLMTGVKVDNPTISAPGTVQYTLQATDESGVSAVRFEYKNQSDSYFQVETVAEKTGTDTYVCTGKIGKYVPTGKYTLMEVELVDSSIRQNSSMYFLEEDELLMDWGYNSVPYNGEVDLQITRTDTSTYCLTVPDGYYEDEAPVQQFEEELAAIPEGSAVILSGNVCEIMSGGGTFISRKALETIKNSKLHVIMTMTGCDAEIVFEGKDLTEEMIQSTPQRGLCVAVSRVEPFEEYVFSGNTSDWVEYFIDMQSFGSEIPFKVRIPVSDAFYDKNKDNQNIRLLNRNDRTGELENIQENLILTNDKFVEITYANGFKGDVEHSFFISTEHVTLFDYPLEVTAALTASDNAVKKGSTFDINLTVTNNNKEAFENVVVFPALTDAMDDNEMLVDMTGQYQITGDNGNVLTDDEGDAVIPKLAAGETVHLKATITIPRGTNFEFAQYTFVAASAYNEEKLESYGEAEVVMSLLSADMGLKGDVNEDGVVDMADLMEELRIVSGRTSISELSADQIWAADVDGNDNVVSMEDLMKMLRFVSGRITSLE